MGGGVVAVDDVVDAGGDGLAVEHQHGTERARATVTVGRGKANRLAHEFLVSGHGWQRSECMLASRAAWVFVGLARQLWDAGRGSVQLYAGAW